MIARWLFRFPRYTLTNGTKTVVFQTMIHVGPAAFYDRIRDDITDHKRQGYVLFYEKVAFSERMRRTYRGLMAMTGAGREVMANLLNLQVQPNDSFLGLVNADDHRVDIDGEDHEAGFAALEADLNKADLEAGLAELKDASPATRRLVTALIWAILGGILLLDRWGLLRHRDPLILDRRNRLVVDALLATPHDRVYVIYGMAHFRGIWADLKARDPSWRIVASRPTPWW